MIKRVVGMTRLAESQASSAMIAMIEEIRTQVESQGERVDSPIVFTGQVEQNGIQVPSHLLLDLYHCVTYVELGFDQQWSSGNVPTVIAKRARRRSELLLRQYLKQHGRPHPVARRINVPQSLTTYHGTISA